MAQPRCSQLLSRVRPLFSRAALIVGATFARLCRPVADQNAMTVGAVLAQSRHGQDDLVRDLSTTATKTARRTPKQRLTYGAELRRSTLLLREGKWTHIEKLVAGSTGYLGTI